jgi:phosphatidylglycerol:prolipoprotein diacylglycerol transferase
MSNTYPWFFSLGALAGLLWLGWADPIHARLQASLPAIARIDAGLSALISGLLGARLGYVLMHIQFYTHHPEEILKMWNGGLTWVGGAVGAILGLGLYSIISKRAFLRLADSLALPTALFAFAVWFGCMLDGCTYGKPSDFGLFTPALLDTFGTRLHRWPIQSSGAIFTLIILAILDRVRLQKPSEGVIASLCLMLIATGSFLLAFLRGDTVPVLYGFRSDALGSAGILVLGSLSLIYCNKRGTKQQPRTKSIVHDQKKDVS